MKPPTKQPWLKFYVRDFSSDPALRMCSLSARGLWIEMLCLMHQADPVGSLLINGRPLATERLAAMVGSSLPIVAAALKELEEAGVFSRDENGTIFSRRMRRDVDKAERDRLNGKGGGNPNLKGPRNPPDKPPPLPFDNPQGNGGVNPPVNGEDKAQKAEARSHIPEAGRPAGAAPLDDAAFEREVLHLVAPWPEVKGSIRELLRLPVDRDRALATVREAVATRPNPVGSWKLMAEIVAEREAAASRPRPAPRGSRPAVDTGPKVDTPLYGRMSVATLLADHAAGNWRKGYGAPIGDSRCVVPVELWPVPV